MRIWIVLALTSATMYALRDVLVKKIFKEKKIDPLQLIFEQYLVVFIITFLLFFSRINFHLFYDMAGLLVVKTLLVGLGLALYYKLIKGHELSLISPLTNIAPALVAVWAYFILAEVLTWTQLAGIILSIISFFLLEISMHHNHQKHISKSIYKKLRDKNFLFYVQIFAMLMLFSFSSIFDRIMFTRGMDVFTEMGFTSGALIIVLIVILMKKKELKEGVMGLAKRPQVFLLSVIFAIATFILLFALMIGDAPVSLIMTLRNTSTFITIFFSGILFHEHHLGKKMLATCGMFAGIVMIIF